VPALKLYNTLTRRSDELRPVRPGTVLMYTCGPTVYRFVHIGNLRSYLLADLIRRALELQGVAVRQVKNITDVGHLTDEMFDRGEDKMLVAARQEHKTPQEIAAFYTKAFHEDEDLLNIEPAQVYPRASDHIPEMIAIVTQLLESGYAYRVGDAIYYDISKFPSYGMLSGNTQERLRAGHRAEVDVNKRHPSDFVLWNLAGGRRLMKWPSPWGEGYPGWHIECSAMSLKHLGDRFDVHTGGFDNIFPHHEDEIAQSQAYLGHLPVEMWVHGEHLLVEGKKMAKSAGNIVRLVDLRERALDPLAFRYLCLTARYRAKLNFTWEAARAADHALRRIRDAIATVAPAEDLSRRAQELDQVFLGYLIDDLDTPQALALMSSTLASALPVGEKRRLLERWDRVLGLALVINAEERQLTEEESALLAARAEARAQRDFAEADRLRGLLALRGIAVADGPLGTSWRRVPVTRRGNCVMPGVGEEGDRV